MRYTDKFQQAAFRKDRKAQIQKNGWALLSSGSINLKTGDSTHFNVLDNGKATLVLLRNHNGNFYVASSAGGAEWLEKNTPINTDKLIISYLTQKQLELRLVIGYYPATDIGLKQIYSVVGKTSVPFSVFK